MSEKRLSSNIKLSEEKYDLLISLYAEQPWLMAREEGMYELLGCCNNQHESDLIKSLILRFNYLTSQKCSEYLAMMVEQIVRRWRLEEEKTQIVATTYDEDADSGQFILWMLKGEFAKNGWDRVKLVNQMGRSTKHVIEYPNIILVDEFAGTGVTLAKRISYLKKGCDHFLRERKSEKRYEIKVCVLGSMEEVRDVVEQDGIEMYAAIWMGKGISGYYEGQELVMAVESMLRLESELQEEVNAVPLPSFGHGKAEALYSVENGNTPNSVFPIFWWPYYLSRKRRKTVFHRYLGNLG